MDMSLICQGTIEEETKRSNFKVQE